MHKSSVPRGPMILGLVLGTMAEAEFSRVVALEHGSIFGVLIRFLNRPISVIIICLIIFSVVHSIYRQVRIRKNKK